MGKRTGRGDIKEAAPEGMPSGALARAINTGEPVGDEASSPRSSFSASYPNAHCHADSPTRGHARAQRSHSGTGLLATSPPANPDAGKGIARSSPRDRMTIEFLSSASSRSPWSAPPPGPAVHPPSFAHLHTIGPLSSMPATPFGLAPSRKGARSLRPFRGADPDPPLLLLGRSPRHFSSKSALASPPSFGSDAPPPAPDLCASCPTGERRWRLVLLGVGDVHRGLSPDVAVTRASRAPKWPPSVLAKNTELGA